MSSAEILATLQSIEKRLSAIENKMGNGGSSNATVAGDATVSLDNELPRSIKAFDDYCVSSLNPFVAACKKLGGDAEKGGNLVADAWGEMRGFLLMASKCKEPAAAAVQPLLAGISGKIKEIGIHANVKHIKTHITSYQRRLL